MYKILFLILVIFGVLLSNSYSKTIDLDTMPPNLYVKKNSKIVLKLRTNPAIAVWQINIQNPENNNVLVKTNQKHKTRNRMIMDGDETLIYEIKAQNKGVSTINGTYASFWAKGEKPMESFSLTVTVK